mmetsp:Transcript_33061/g.71556  ORF Transcript_33061/g.71556 Transcript_33061/m.71556 type:complete len:373 (-) Transcript_33061:2931-4049(-)
MLVLPLLLASAPPMAPKAPNYQQHHRAFQFVPYGQSAPTCGADDNSDKKVLTTISCDGRIEGTTLELTHWNGNETPNELYDDTSTEIALNFARKLLGGGYDNASSKSSDDDDIDIDNALILNNHFDTDGVLSVWTCLNPSEALEKAEILVAGAEAGDFGEWSTDLGVKLDCALCEVEAGCDSEEEAYNVALDLLPLLLDDLETNNGANHEELWKRGWDDAMAGWNSIADGRVKIEQASAGLVHVALVKEGAGAPASLSPYALHRGLKEAGLGGDQPNAVDRVLHCRAVDGKDGRYRYEYNKPGYGWVSRLVKRKPVASVDNDMLIRELNAGKGGSWSSGGGLTGICRTSAPGDIGPSELLEKLEFLESEGAR